MSVRSSMLSDTILLTVVNVAMRSISMGFQVFLSKRLGAEGIGLLQLVLNAGGFAMTLGLSGIRMGAMYLCAEKFGRNDAEGVRGVLRSCLLYGFVCSVTACVLLYLLSGQISARFIRIAGADEPLRHFALGIPLNVGIFILSGYFTACKQIKRVVAVEIADRVLSCGLTAFMLLSREQNVKAVCACVDAGNISAAISLSVLLAQAIPDVFGKHANKGELKNVIQVSAPMALNDYLRSGLYSIEHFLIPIGLSAYYADAKQALAQYGKIHGMVFPVMMFPAVVLQSLSELLVPELSRLCAQENAFRSRMLVKKCIRLGFFYSVGISYLLFYLAPQLSEIAYADSSVGSLLRVFAPMVLMLYADSIVDAMCKGLGKQVECVQINVFTSVLDIAALLFLLPRYGIYGYILSFAAVHLVNFYLSIRLLLKTVSWTPRLAPIFKCVLCAAICAFICLAIPRYVSRTLYCALYILAFFILYGYFLGKLRALQKSEQVLLQVVNRSAA